MADAASKALILDFGGVISRTLFETHDLSEAALGLPPGTLTWRGPFDPSTDPLWRAMQANEISERDYWTTRTREVGRLVGVPGEGRAWCHHAGKGESLMGVATRRSPVSVGLRVGVPVLG